MKRSAVLNEAFLKELKEVSSSDDPLIKGTAIKIRQWLKALSEGSISEYDLLHLLDSRRRKILNYMNTLAIEKRNQLKKTILRIIDLIMGALLNQI